MNERLGEHGRKGNAKTIFELVNFSFTCKSGKWDNGDNERAVSGLPFLTWKALGWRGVLVLSTSSSSSHTIFIERYQGKKNGRRRTTTIFMGLPSGMPGGKAMGERNGMELGGRHKHNAAADRGKPRPCWLLRMDFWTLFGRCVIILLFYTLFRLPVLSHG